MSANRRPSRRAFLQNTGLGAASVALAGGLAIGRGAHAAGSDELKIALIGCGGRGTGAVANAFRVNHPMKLVAVADTFPIQCERAVTQLRKENAAKVDVPADRVFAGFDAYKAAIDCADYVIIATPPGMRPPQYRYAIEKGKHVFTEKPLCTDAAGFNSIMETNKLADEKGLKVGVGLQRHAEPRYIETIQRIHDGAIGALQFLRVYWNMGNIWAKAREANDTEMMYQVRNWQYFCYFGGDHIVEQHVHNLDIANWVMKGHPVEAVGMGGRQRRDEFKDMGHIYDHHFVEFTYADGTKLFSQCRQTPNCWNQVGEFAHGTKGWSDCCSKIEGKTTWKFNGAKPNPYDQEHVNLVEAILKNTKYNEGWHGATSTMTAVLGRMATYSGNLVKWDDAVANAKSIVPEKLAWDVEPPMKPDAAGTYRAYVAQPGIYKAY